MLEGELEITLGDRLVRVSTGDSLEVSPGERHRVLNLGHGNATFLVISAPTTQGDRVNLE